MFLSTGYCISLGHWQSKSQEPLLTHLLHVGGVWGLAAEPPLAVTFSWCLCCVLLLVVGVWFRHMLSEVCGMLKCWPGTGDPACQGTAMRLTQPGELVLPGTRDSHNHHHYLLNTLSTSRHLLHLHIHNWPSQYIQMMPLINDMEMVERDQGHVPGVFMWCWTVDIIWDDPVL